MARARKSHLSTEQFQAIARALADPRRFAMLQQIANCNSECPMACSALEEQKTISPATISHHLKELQEAGLIDAAREGRIVRMSLRRDIWNAYLERLAEL